MGLSNISDFIRQLINSSSMEIVTKIRLCGGELSFVKGTIKVCDVSFSFFMAYFDDGFKAKKHKSNKRVY